jgi:alpha-L-fucosidase 2
MKKHSVILMSLAMSLISSCFLQTGRNSNSLRIWYDQPMNINVEMNYWPAEVSNLSELHDPFFSLVKAVAANGAFTAKKTFDAGGWCGGHNSDIWEHSDMVGNLGEGHTVWSIWYMKGPWVCQHLWQHYLFTGNLEFLRETAFPLMKGAADPALSARLGRLI